MEGEYTSQYTDRGKPYLKLGEESYQEPYLQGFPFREEGTDVRGCGLAEESAVEEASCVVPPTTKDSNT